MAEQELFLKKAFWDVSPSWQNSIQSVETIKHKTVTLGAYKNCGLIGYIIYNSESKRIHQLAVHKSFRKSGVASSLISKIVTEFGSSISIINVDTNSGASILFFQSIRLKQYLKQLEMELVI